MLTCVYTHLWISLALPCTNRDWLPWRQGDFCRLSPQSWRGQGVPEADLIGTDLLLTLSGNLGEHAVTDTPQHVEPVHIRLHGT